MPDLPDELRDRAAIILHNTLNPADTGVYVAQRRMSTRERYGAAVDAVVEVLAEHQAAECTCIPTPSPENVWCDAHGLPSAAWRLGIENGVQQERALSEMRTADLRVRAERAEALVEECPRCHLCLTCTIDDCAGCARSVSPDQETT